MGKLRYILFFLIIINLLYSHQSKAEDVLTVGIAGTNGVAREMVYTIAAAFEKKNPNVKVKFIVKEGESYKSELQHMLVDDAGYDVAFWMSGERFDRYIRLGLVAPITDIWQSRQLANSFAKNLNNAITFKNQIYAIPFSRYQWGMLYNKNLFTRLSIEPPKTWPQFIDALTELKNKQVIPIYLGSKYTWSVSAWFEYLNLRLNGYDFHQSFVKGKMPIDSPQIRLVFNYWQQLIDAGFFVVNRDYQLKEGLPLIYREKAGIILAGSYFTAFIPQTKFDDIGFFSFPQINPKVDNVEIAPVDIAFVAQRTKNKPLAKEFLVFLSSKYAQEKFNSGSHFLPANKLSEIPNNGIFQSVQESLNNVRQQTLFFDREAEYTFAQRNMSIWRDYVEGLALETVIKKMEEARVKLLSCTGNDECNN